MEREVAQAGSALGLGPRGRRFESCLPDQQKKDLYKSLNINEFCRGFFFNIKTYPIPYLFRFSLVVLDIQYYSIQVYHLLL